jgi:hypothetical protein
VQEGHHNLLIRDVAYHFQDLVIQCM